MRIFGLIFLLVAAIGFCAWYKAQPRVIPGTYAALNIGIKWDDKFMDQLPADMDTSIIVRDAIGNPLKFAQYLPIVFNHEGFIFQDRGVWRLMRFTEGARDTLKRDTGIVARLSRWAAFRPDTIQDPQVKLKALAKILNQVDRVLVLKSQRQLILQRQGKDVKTFHIELGMQPVGKKQFEGDGKTPEGTYTLDVKYTRGDAYYKSFLLSYPNKQEKAYAASQGKKPGMSILIHGTKPNKIKAKDWTAGCIAMQNDDMDKLFDNVAEGTLIEVRP
ncbi:L,D-transpeptidase family protein [Mucilaginibacter myungsuensis]|uniref:L,D-transpeptidase family protein n=1 Tax=Mucilaginibacter myungsuensis TaxID=649104 RepID=A0A929L1G1_9SPHI|nr:L,D-transpeptidase family protein [Mucilaginibacter myungsuensis]MBE9662355.1 L,D-transpeptidase family protein [Mucilaginibacter myungsuensis]MDN3599208.1 L,D-transpeptidase family protein [Mucilaginibacter myungsuensis]